jgi:hypothetical protein
LVPISWGEDKITILEIKVERLTARSAQANVATELNQLREIAHSLEHSADTSTLVARLKELNGSLWQIEDDIRDLERSRTFDSAFVELARSIYRLNDERAAVKRALNLAFGSKIIEEKSYKPY